MENEYNPNEFFPGYLPGTQKSLLNFMTVMGDIGQTFLNSQIVLHAVGILTNIVHLLILTRKDMRTSSTNIIMIGLAVCEIWSMSAIYRSGIIGINGFLEPSCSNPITYLYIYYSILVSVEEVFLIKFQVYLVIVMSTIRTLSIRNAMNPKFDILPKAPCGWYSIWFTFLASLMFSSSFILTQEITSTDPKNVRFDDDDPNCPPNITEALNFFPNSKYAWFSFTNSIFTFIPCIALPVLTVLLVIELRKAGETRRKVSMSKESEQSNRTTRLVTFIAASFMVAEIPNGLNQLFLFFFNSLGFRVIAWSVDSIIAIIIIFNTVTRGMVCYAMSSQYRDATRELFGCGQRKFLKRGRNSKTSINASSSTKNK